jgi:hypothetical protein
LTKLNQKKSEHYLVGDSDGAQCQNGQKDSYTNNLCQNNTNSLCKLALILQNYNFNSDDSIAFMSYSNWTKADTILKNTGLDKTPLPQTFTFPDINGATGKPTGNSDHSISLGRSDGLLFQPCDPPDNMYYLQSYVCGSNNSFCSF